GGRPHHARGVRGSTHPSDAGRDPEAPRRVARSTRLRRSGRQAQPRRRSAVVLRDVAYVALGSNLGDRDEHLARARRALTAIPRTRVIAISTVEETAPIGPVEQGRYLNQMVALETELSPRELLAELQRIEQEGGRTREVRW